MNRWFAALRSWFGLDLPDDPDTREVNVLIGDRDHIRRLDLESAQDIYARPGVRHDPNPPEPFYSTWFDAIGKLKIDVAIFLVSVIGMIALIVHGLRHHAP